MALAAQQLVQAGRIRLEGKLRDRSSALRALPIPLVHLALKATTSVLIKTHAGLCFLFFDSLVYVPEPDTTRFLRLRVDS